MGALATGFAGCSSETSRFNNPNANPFASRSSAPAEVTGSVQSAPVNRISSQPLPPPPNTSRPSTVASSGVSGGGQGMGSYNPSYNPAPAPVALPPPPPNHDITGSVPARQALAQAGWNWDGGTVVMVSPGETTESLSRKYGVPASAIIQANNLSGPGPIQPGQRIIIPRYNYSAAAPVSVPAAQPAVTKPRAPTGPAAVIGGNVHIVAPGDTLMSISRHYHKPLTEIAAANKIPPHTLLKIGDRIVIPGKLAVAQPAPAVAAPKVQPPVRAQAPVAAPKVTTAEATPTARLATPATEATAVADAGATASTGTPAFRWPLRGRVITGFGLKSNGQQSDGIDLAVPEGTAVHAAEDGVVAYAGNELKGYGNLILIRHANGFVTAYAHTSEVMVKRNDQIRRGQVIAKSGQTGSVTSPQLHFEIRKGSAPVDPTQYLPGA